MQIDHLFIRVSPGGAEAEALRAFGLSEGSGNVHPGQGTANRRFFFANAFIELLWIADETEIANQTTRPTMLRERLSDGDASPFGICFRPAVPFATWNYAPAYLPPGMQIGIATDAPLTEPMWFHTSAGKAPAAFEGDRRQPLHHAAGLGSITALRCTLPSVAALSSAAHASGIAFAEGPHLLEISFDHETRGLQHDFRPALPLIFKY
ncbi:glyoxalase-like domain protein [Pseudoduganella sp. FT25W]|uniref:Glyoxalase-like domain protein n=1 Tax=Duganella alba TaxID=2666081 RepID=A0A6L5QDV6_9BURK|nr:VOC family protein [Duganella alba]MRX07849.1 glyoxalase-like domain protein [Duganella alba]MRX15452.1 glyoxalase-like domain protein [Duganella alba]